MSYKGYYAAWKISRPEKMLYDRSKERARASGIEFTLKLEDIVIPPLCPILNIPLTLVNESGQRQNPNAPSVDRIDNSKGYTKDNIQIVSWRANNLKGKATLEEWRLIEKWMVAVKQ